MAGDGAEMADHSYLVRSLLAKIESSLGPNPSNLLRFARTRNMMGTSKTR